MSEFWVRKDRKDCMIDKGLEEIFCEGYVGVISIFVTKES